MSKLTKLIPEQNFELILQRIAFILADELGGQFALDNTIEEFSGKVYVERTKPFDQSESFAYVVAFPEGQYTGKTIKDQDGDYTYMIDCYATAKDSDAVPGDTLSATKMLRMLGAVRSILESPHYNILSFPAGFINGTMVKSVQAGDPENNLDAKNTRRGRVIFNVRANETTELQTSTLLKQSNTTVLISGTDKGYFYSNQLVSWILETGIWNDSGIWDDTAVWIDEP
jgi:hypothetical protein